MRKSIPQLSRYPRIVIACLSFSIAVVLFLLPSASARIKVATNGRLLTTPRLHEPTPSSVSESPVGAESTFVVNDSGDAADLIGGNGICDTNIAPGEQCTLRAAIQEANAVFSSDTITFSLPAGSTIILTTALPNITGNLTISGPGSNLLSVMRNAAGGTPDFRIFTSSNTTTNYSGLTITNGKTPDGESGVNFGVSAQNGGGILHNNGAIALIDVVITGNRTGNGGPATGGSNSLGGVGGFGGGISASGTLTMTNCVVRNNTTGNGGTGGSGQPGGYGGGIHFSSGMMTLTNVLVDGNQTGDGGVGVNGGLSGGNSGYGGGIFGAGTLNMAHATISNNVTGDVVRGNAGGGGGLYIFSGTSTLTNSVVSTNHTGSGSGFLATGGSGGGISNNANLTVSGSLVNGNTTGNSDSSASAIGGGIHNNFVANLMNSTVSGNSTGTGLSRGGGIFNGATLKLTNCTLTANSASNNSGNGLVAGSSTIVRNTIIARNGPGGNGPDLHPGFISTSFSSQGHNLIGNADGSPGFTATGDQAGTGAAPLDPLLGPLSDNGGSTMTHALLDGSPALDAADACVTEPAHCGDANIPQLTIDQRGAGFNRIVDGPDANTTATVDIGAFEKQPTFPNLPATSGNEDTTIIVTFEVLDSASITSITATSSNTALVPNSSANINVTGRGSNGVLTISPTANLSGMSDITVTANGASGSASSTFTLTINPVNDAPSFTKGPDQSVNENSGGQIVNNWATNISSGPADESGQTLTFQVTGNTNAPLFSTAPAISANGTLTYTPAAGASGLATITVALMDNGGTSNGGNNTSATQTFLITVLDGGTLQFSNIFPVNENGNPVITVTRGPGSAGEARVDYATSDGSATSGLDYTAASGTLVFANGITTQSFQITLNDDSIDEPNETINLTLSNASGTGALGSQTTSQLLIFDNDPTPNLRINDVSVTEGVSGTIDAVFTVTLSAASSFSVTANFATADSSAVAPGDYLSKSGFLTLNPGELTKTISVTVNGDTVAEVHESFFVNLTSPINALFADSQGVGTILSDDPPGGTLAFTVLHDSVNENAGFATIIVNRNGDTAAAVTVNYATSDGNASLVSCATASGNASARCDFTTALGTLRLAAGDASESFIVLINQDNFVEGPEILTLTLSNPGGGAVFASAATVSGSLTIADDVTEPAPNPIDDADAFVRQHYHDFLNREADVSGLAFWKNEILSCGADAQCIEVKRINVSAAFYLSIEFQETGYLVERMYKVSYGNAFGTSTLGGTHQFPVPVIRLNEFLPDTQEIGLGVVVGQPGWEQALENNKRLFADRFVQRARFTAANAFPTTMTASQFVDKLNTNAGGVLLPDERIQLINELSTGAKTRAQVMRTIAEDADLAITERNRAFVLMQYFGYLRRNPNDSPDSNHTGYEFWLNKLTEFGGNFVSAEMVKAFINADEYRRRFGQ